MNGNGRRNNNHNNPSSLELFVRNNASARFSSGYDQVIEFKTRHDGQSINNGMFFCKLCHTTLNNQTLYLHCSSLVHLFRYVKHQYPSEYERFLTTENLRHSTMLFRDYLLAKLAKKGLIVQRTSAHLVNNLREAYAFMDHLRAIDRIVDLTGIQHELELINEEEERTEITQRTDSREMSSNLKHTNTFLRNLMLDDDDC